MRPATDMKPGEILHLRNGYTVELESVKPVTCGVMLTFKASAPDRKEPKRMRPATDMKPGEILHLRNGYTVELESVKPVTCGVMLTFKASAPDRKENHNER